MMNLPLEAILFWIAVMLAPADTSQILVKGPGIRGPGRNNPPVGAFLPTAPCGSRKGKP